MDATTGIIIGIALPAAISLGTGLLAKFAPRQKCADWLWAVLYPLIVALDKLLDIKVGKKSAEIIQETVFGTIAYVMQSTAARINNFLRLQDTDGSEK